jgi:hypothetical protein
VRALAEEGDGNAEDSRAYREKGSVDEGGSILGKIVSSLPDGRKNSAPEVGLPAQVQVESS